MNRKKALVFLLLIGLLCTAFFVYSKLRWTAKAKSNEVYEISVVCRGKDMEDRASLKAGINQAADDLSAEVNYITLSKENDAAQQISAMKREAGSGANAILIFPADSESVVEPVRQAAGKIPVVVLQPYVQGFSGICTVSCDEFRLGESLARKIISDGNAGHSADFHIIYQAHQSNPQLIKGLAGVLGKPGVVISETELPDDRDKAYDTAKSILMQKGRGNVIALDSGSLETVGKVKSDLVQSGVAVPAKIYGAGRTDAVVSLLENNAVEAVGAEDEYSLGYLGVKMAIDGIHKKSTKNINVNYVIADKTNMYKPQNEYILFPFLNH